MSDDDLVMLTVAASEIEAAEVCGYLEANGIKAMYYKGGVGFALGSLTPSIGRQEIVVRAEDAERARELLAQMQP